MKPKNYFSLNRIFHLLLNDLRLHSRVILITVATLMLLQIFIPAHFVGSMSIFLLVLYTGGFLLTGYAFNELHDRQRAHFYLMLPCSNLERVISKWLLTSIIYTFTTLILYYLFSLAYVLIHEVIFNKNLHVFNILDSNLWLYIAKYIILQSLVFLGSAFFKKNVLIKTTLALGCFFVLISILTIVISWIICPNCFIKEFLLVAHYAFRGIDYAFWLICLPVCWYLTYLRITESELI